MTSRRLFLAALPSLALAAFVVFPLAGVFPVVRVAPILLFCLLVVTLQARPWAWPDSQWSDIADWNPSGVVLRAAATVVGFTLFWFVVTRFRSGEINAIDFTVYYDRPIFQTLLGKPLFIESADDPARAFRWYFSVHAHWIMLPLAALYWLAATPLWVLALSVFAVVMGAKYVFRIVQSTGGGGALAAGSALAFAFNDNTARTLNYGFHAEVLYAWFVPWMLHAASTRRWRQFALSAVLCVTVKEDAFLLLSAVAVTVLLVHGSALSRTERFVYLAAPVVLALVNLAVFFKVIVPALSPTGLPFYSNYWSNYGVTTTAAAIGMLLDPLSVGARVLTSGFWSVISPHLFLPVAGWRWAIGALPIVVLYGAAANEQMRSFGIYYAIVLVPFLVLGAAKGVTLLADHAAANAKKARVIGAAIVVAGALLPNVSTGGYSLRPWRSEIAALPHVLRQLEHESSVLVQGGLYPHAGYSSRVQLLTRQTLADERYASAAIVLAPALSGYPMNTTEIEVLAARPALIAAPEGVVVVRSRGSGR